MRPQALQIMEDLVSNRTHLASRVKAATSRPVKRFATCCEATVALDETMPTDQVGFKVRVDPPASDLRG
jgi:hypothetical protein